MARSALIPTLVRFESGISPPDDVVIRLFLDDGTERTLSIPHVHIPVLILELMRQSGQLPPPIQSTAPMPETVVPLPVARADPLWGPDGQRGMAIRLEGGLQITLALTDTVIAGIRSVLDQVAQGPAPTPTSH